jgi:hypothetical protein
LIDCPTLLPSGTMQNRSMKAQTFSPRVMRPHLSCLPNATSLRRA